MYLLREVVKAWLTEASYEIALALAKKRKLFLTEKKLIGLVSRYMQVWVIKALNGKQVKMHFLSRLLRDVTRNSLIMCLSN